MGFMIIKHNFFFFLQIIMNFFYSYRSELVEQQKSTREEKKKLRRQLREFEDEFQNRTGRKLQKEDRLPMETVYTDYKHIKAKLRLLEALLKKK